MTVLMFGVHPSGCSTEVQSVICERNRVNSLAYSMFGVRRSMFDVSGTQILNKSPYLHFLQKSNCPQHSRLMGGQFPTKKRHGTFKNPIFYAGKFFGIFKKNELSFLMPQKTTFFTIFSTKTMFHLLFFIFARCGRRSLMVGALLYFSFFIFHF